MDNIFLKQQARENHPAGTFAAVCVDVIDLGMRIRDFQGHKSAQHTVALVFRTGKTSKDGFALDLAQEFGVSLSERSNLRKFIEAWHGKKLTLEECGSGFLLSEYAKKPAMISVIHKPSADGSRSYANIGAVMPMPEGMVAPSAAGYERAPYWKERREKYAEEFRAFMNEEPDDPTLDQETPF